MLTLYRRHLKSCPYRTKGQAYIKCSCPIWCDGEVNGDRIRKSLDTRDWARATRKLGEIEDPSSVLLPCAQPGCTKRVRQGRCDQHRKAIADAVQAFRNHGAGLEQSTQTKYRNNIGKFLAFCQAAGLKEVSDITVEHLDAFRAGRKLGARTSLSELQVLRQFFGFCVSRKWAAENVAKQVEAPRNIKPTEIVPYTQNEISMMITACEGIGRASYERLRAKAMILLLNNTALRISDVALLARDRVRNGRVVLRTLKTGDIVSLPIWKETKAALDALPFPRGTVDGGAFFFWNGTTTKRAAVGTAQRTLAAVFKRSGVIKAHPHRFRHTLATRLLGNGASEQEVADILGNSPAIVRKHYAKWSRERQQRIDQRIAELAIDSGTSTVHEKSSSVIN